MNLEIRNENNNNNNIVKENFTYYTLFDIQKRHFILAAIKYLMLSIQTKKNVLKMYVIHIT